MTHETTILADHKGMTTPKVSGDEYYVDAVVDITAYTAGGEVITATELGLSSITQVLVTGREAPTSGADIIVDNVFPEVSAAGAYESGGSFKLHSTIASTGAITATNATTINMVRIRAYGLI